MAAFQALQPPVPFGYDHASVKQYSFREQLIRGSFYSTFACSSGRKWINSSVLSAAFVLLLCAGEPRASAQVTVLHSFGDGSVANDGASPAAGLIQAPDGNFYGVTGYQAGKTGPNGTVFQMTPAGVVRIIKRFTSQTLIGPLLYYKKTLIGVAGSSPTEPNGALFALTGYPDGPWAKHFWHKFGGTAGDGIGPVGGLALGSGDLYGTTMGAGSAGDGTIYKVNFRSHNYTVVYSFSDTSGTGIFPNTALARANDGNFYGGAEGLFGAAIFEMMPNGQVTLFEQLDGNAFLTGPMTKGSDGNLYGTAGGQFVIGSDFVFRFTTGPGGGVGFLASLRDVYNGQTMGVIEAPNGNIYGLSLEDGTAGMGTVFELAAGSNIITILHNFGDGSVQNDGAFPVGTLVVGSDNNLYGTTGGGGSAGLGTVFRISP